MVDAVAFKFQTGTQGVHLTEKYGNWRGVYNRLRMWAVDGAWERVFIALMARADAGEDLNWAVSVASTIVRAHQHAAGAPQKGAPADEPDDRAISCSRGGLTTKIHLAADGRCRPLAFPLTGIDRPRRRSLCRARSDGGDLEREGRAQWFSKAARPRLVRLRASGNPVPVTP